MGEYWRLLNLKIVKVETNHAGSEIRRIILTSPQGVQHEITFGGLGNILLDNENIGIVRHLIERKKKVCVCTKCSKSTHPTDDIGHAYNAQREYICGDCNRKVAVKLMQKLGKEGEL